MKQGKIINMAERRRKIMLDQSDERARMEMLAYAIVVLFVGMLLFVAIAIDWQ